MDTRESADRGAAVYTDTPASELARKLIDRAAARLLGSAASR